MTSIGNNLPSILPYVSLLDPAASVQPVAAIVPEASTPLPSTGVGGQDDGSPQLSSDLITLLQSLQSGESTTSSLIGGASSPTDPLLALFGNSSAQYKATQALLKQAENTLQTASYASAVQAAYAGVAAQAAAQTNSASGVESALATYQAAYNAYNATALTAAQEALAANSYGANGESLVA